MISAAVFVDSRTFYSRAEPVPVVTATPKMWKTVGVAAQPQDVRVMESSFAVVRNHVMQAGLWPELRR
jgi:hypothetical protein